MRPPPPSAARRTVAIVAASGSVVDRLIADVLAEMEDAAPQATRKALRRVLTALDVKPGDPAWSDGVDVLGAAYERLLDGTARRPRGQFFSPFWIGEVLAQWVFASEQRLVLDPGCGSAALLISAANVRGQGATALLGLDVDPLAIAMAATNRRLRQIPRLELRRANFLLDPLAERPTGILCNPPYTRHHALPATEKAAIQTGFRVRLGLELSQLASLHALFLLRSLEVAADGARIAFITPAHWLDTNYARPIKEYVKAETDVEGLIYFNSAELFYGGPLTSAVITLLHKRAPRREPTGLLKLESPLPSPEDVLERLKDSPQTLQLDPDRKWSAPARRRTHRGIKLEQLASVRRGVATGCNAFFVLSDFRRREFGLSKSYLRPCLTTPRLFPAHEVTLEDLEALDDEQPRWILDAQQERRAGPLADYLAWGRQVHKADESYLASQRCPWFALEWSGEAPIVFSYLNKTRARFVLNRANALPLNNWLIIQPRASVDPDELLAILTSRPVMGRLLDDARLYDRGLWKLEPRELRQLRLPISAKKLL